MYHKIRQLISTGKNQIETDIKTAYEAFKEKFCFRNISNKDITVHIFNNISDYTKYDNLLDMNAGGTHGITDDQKVLIYKQDFMDFF